MTYIKALWRGELSSQRCPGAAALLLRYSLKTSHNNSPGTKSRDLAGIQTLFTVVGMQLGTLCTGSGATYGVLVFQRCSEQLGTF